MLFRPNVACQIASVVGYDAYGKPQMGGSRNSKCAVIRLDLGAAKTSVRVDSSASRGFATEKVVVARLLFARTESITVDDRIDIAGVAVRVSSVAPQYSVTGALDHFQVDCVNWGDG